jgi:hypothetical protein
MNPLYTNDTCLPTTDPTASCKQGYLSEYAIVAKKEKHIAAGVKFAKRNNIRLVIRNTGHDFMGRSSAYRGLTINTHSFKDVAFTRKYKGPGEYRGGAMTAGAGTQVGELYKLAFEQNPKVTVVGGECAVSIFSFVYSHKLIFQTDCWVRRRIHPRRWAWSASNPSWDGGRSSTLF